MIFAAIYYFFRLLHPIKSKKIFCIMTHDGSKDGNVGRMVEYLKNENEGYTFSFLHKSERNQAKDVHKLKGKLDFFFVKTYHLATSEFILMDNTFIPMAFMRFSKRVSVVQLWHGTGTIKKFGQDVNKGQLKWFEKKANGRITHLIVNSKKSKKIYARAFGIPEDRVFIYGLPRTDLFFDSVIIEERKEHFYREFPALKGKKLVLFAPTFRDNEGTHPKLALDLQRWEEKMPEDCVLLLRVHPFVAEAYEKDMRIVNSRLANKSANNRIISMSSYPEISTLLLVSDYLITDYSSVIFDYCLMNRPMIFYAYDLDQFSDQGRGFYEEYEEVVPGKVVRDTDTLINIFLEKHYDTDEVKTFVRENYQFIDGKSTQRLYLHIFKSK